MSDVRHERARTNLFRGPIYEPIVGKVARHNCQHPDEPTIIEHVYTGVQKHMVAGIRLQNLFAFVDICISW